MDHHVFGIQAIFSVANCQESSTQEVSKLCYIHCMQRAAVILILCKLQRVAA